MALKDEMQYRAAIEAVRVMSMDFMWQALWEKKRRSQRVGFKGAKKYRANRKAKNKVARQSRRANSR